MKRHIATTADAAQDPSAACRPEELADQLSSSPLFAAIPADEVREVLSAFDEQSFNVGHRITLEGLRGTDFFVILDGRARVSVDNRSIGQLSPGDFFGELGVLGDGLRFATVTALTPLRCLILPHGKLKQLLVAHPQMGVNVLGEVVSRFHDLAGHKISAGSGFAAGEVV